MGLHQLLQVKNYLVCPNCISKQCYSHNLETNVSTLKCSNCLKTYPILQGVPILIDGVAEDILEVCGFHENTTYKEFVSLVSNLSERAKFYYDHYPPEKADRSAYLKSGYLANEKKYIEGFLQNKSLNGICLEIGCAVGQFADISNKYVGIEYSLSAVFAKGFENYARIVASAESIPLAENTVEFVFTFNTLEHIPNPSLAFREIDRILMPGGWAILKPAWHCTKYNTELLPIKSYSQLSFPLKVKKFLLPLLRAKFIKFLTRVPVRIARRFVYTILQLPTELRYRRLVPYLGQDTDIADADATADIDCHEGLLYFESRGYKIMSHKTIISRLFAGNELLLLQKPICY